MRVHIVDLLGGEKERLQRGSEQAGRRGRWWGTGESRERARRLGGVGWGSSAKGQRAATNRGGGAGSTQGQWSTQGQAPRSQAPCPLRPSLAPCLPAVRPTAGRRPAAGGRRLPPAACFVPAGVRKAGRQAAGTGFSRARKARRRPTWSGVTPTFSSARSMKLEHETGKQMENKKTAQAHLVGRHPRLLQRAFNAHDHALALGLRLGHVVRVAREGAADELCQDGGAPRLGVLQLLQHQHSCRGRGRVGWVGVGWVGWG